jgi:hypothetical protein
MKAENPSDGTAETLGWRAVQTIALWSSGFSLWFTGAVMLVGRWGDNLCADLWGLFVFTAMIWVVIFVPFALGFRSTVRHAARVRAAYGITTTREGRLILSRLNTATAEPGQAYLDRCRQFIHDTFTVRELRMWEGGGGFTARVGPFASWYFPFQIDVALGEPTNGRRPVRLATQTRMVLGQPIVDLDGVSALVVLANWMQGRILPRGTLDRPTWEVVVRSAESSEPAPRPPRVLQGADRGRSGNDSSGIEPDSCDNNPDGTPPPGRTLRPERSR